LAEKGMKRSNRGVTKFSKKKIDYINKQMNGTGYEVRVKNSEGIKLDRTGCITREKLGINRLIIHLLFS